jgi:adenylate cyclase
MTFSFIHKAYYLIGFFCLFTSILFGQNQKEADSLIILYESGSFQGDELELLKRIAEAETNPERVIEFSELLIKKAAGDSLFYYRQSGYLQKGNALNLKGNNAEALEAYFESLHYASQFINDIQIGSLMISIADIYANMENTQNATNYYNKGIRLLRKVNDSIKIATALLNAGDAYFYSRKLDSALIYTRESQIIFQKQNYLIGQAYSLGNMGMLYAEQGKDAIAEENINEAITILEELGNYYPISVYLTYLADIYVRKNNMKAAFLYAKKSLDLANKYGFKKGISDASLKLSELYEKAGDQPTSYKYYKDHIVYRDSVKNIESVQQMANQEVSQKQTELNLKETALNLSNQQKKNQKVVMIATAIALFLIGLLAFGLFRRNKFIQKTKKIIEEERNRSDSLLLNILPEETAQELKESGKVKAKKFESVTVLFTDFKGFTSYSNNLSPEVLVETIGFYFSKFDAIIEKHGLEKIKTIGDAYMCAGGLPFPTENHAENMVKAAMEIAEFVTETKKNVKATEMNFDVRIGINTGPVVAGVVGAKKFAYDIWGDTVNIASRMESNSEPGKINVSENTYELIKDQFDCAYRGELEVKNKGMMKMYFVNGIKA